MKRFLLLLIVLVLASAVSCASTLNSIISVPLPPDIQIIAPDPKLPSEIKAFSGKWAGKWWSLSFPLYQGVDAILVVEKIIDERRAVVVYGWGDSWTNIKGWVRFTANLSRDEKGKIVLSWVVRRTREEVEFRLEGDNKLEGWIPSRGGSYIVLNTMKRFQ